mmetsp:Transcript_7788/g.13115  ORF Transcript_7788/g.13115 Transcript_7788/m.13115 type:complete len:426 (-) Transcript_7788:47-1324(-)
MPKDKQQKRGPRLHHHNPLAVDIIESTSTLAKSKATTGRKGREREERRENIPTTSTRVDRSILIQAKEQQKEENPQIEPKRLPNYAGSSDEEDFSDNEMTTDFEVHEELVIDEADEEALSMFMKNEPKQRKTIADIIMEKMREQELQGNRPQSTEPAAPKLHPKVIQVYRGVGKVLHYYSAGKVPKAFKIIPSLNNWEEVVYLTDPDGWSMPTYYVATRLFASNLNEKMAQRFYNIILLPKVMDDIAENKRLNYHLYRALKKAVYKPAAFYKGIILPLCEQGCSIHEASIIASVIKKVSVPVLQSSAALYKMAQMEYNGTVNIFMNVLLTKKYALPYRVIDKLVEHYCAFSQERRRLPVIWHQGVLTFSQRYKEDLTKEQKDAIKSLIKVHSHPQISSEVRRELDNSCSRGEVLNADETRAMMIE